VVEMAVVMGISSVECRPIWCVDVAG